jgi:hypothetical protein
LYKVFLIFCFQFTRPREIIYESFLECFIIQIINLIPRSSRKIYLNKSVCINTIAISCHQIRIISPGEVS